MKELIITNGDSGADILRAANIGDFWLPWRDLLHEGPVPLTNDFPSLSRIRAEYIASKGWADKDKVIADFMERDGLLISADRYDRISLWFEHDLYDQLQLIQVLDALSTYSLGGDKIYLVQTNDYIGHQSPETIGQFQEKRQPISSEQFNLAKEVWTAFRQPTPEVFATLLGRDLMALPFLNTSIHRMLEELPSASGVSRSEHQILFLIDRGVTQAGKLFTASQKMEEAMFMGDWSFFDRLMSLAHCREPLISGLESFQMNPYLNEEKRVGFLTAKLGLTDFGKLVLSGHSDFTSLNDVYFWWGGTEIEGDNIWRWEPKNKLLFKS